MAKHILRPSTGKELSMKIIPPRHWIVPGLITEGVTILAGRPKTGKSWLMLGAALAVAEGGFALGEIPVEQGDVLYMALEDSEGRLQERQKQLLYNNIGSEHFHYITSGEMPPLNQGGIEALDDWLVENPQAKMVVIDTLGRVKPEKKGNSDSYDHDTKVISSLQEIAFKHRIAIVVIHHTRKMATTDAVEEVSGTFGLTGAADAILVMVKQFREGIDAILKITGRDIQDDTKNLKFDRVVGLWSITGDALSLERKAIEGAIWQKQKPLRPREIADLLNKNRNSIRWLIKRMVADEQLKRLPDGTYTLITIQTHQT